MENKDPNTWQAIDSDNIEGELMYNSAGSVFEYTFHAMGLENTEEYNLIYYADCDADGWPGDCPGALIATFMTSGTGAILTTSSSIDLGIDLPCSTDYNYPAGAKIWLVPSNDYTAPGLTAWNPTTYLFETDLITYHDTNNGTALSMFTGKT